MDGSNSRRKPELGRILGMGTPLKRYFSRCESASTVIDAIIRSLKNGQEQLKRDTITLVDDQKLMRELTNKLERAVKLGQLITGTAERLETQGAAIHKQASATQIDLGALKRAFEAVRAAMDDVSRYRQETPAEDGRPYPNRWTRWPRSSTKPSTRWSRRSAWPRTSPLRSSSTD